MSRQILLAATLLVASAAATAADTASRPGNGITSLDLLGDGTRAMMVVGRRENFNAHSFDVASLYVRTNGKWELVPVFGKDKEHDELTTSEGADCLLHDFRFFRRQPHAPLELVIADRDYGDSFVAERPVTFQSYALVRNADSTPGAPTWSYRLRATVTSVKSYCDVGDAFKQESGWHR